MGSELVSETVGVMGIGTPKAPVLHDKKSQTVTAKDVGLSK